MIWYNTITDNKDNILPLFLSNFNNSTINLDSLKKLKKNKGVQEKRKMKRTVRTYVPGNREKVIHFEHTQ